MLEDRGGYRSDREAWEAVLRDPTLAIVDPAFLQNGGGPANFAAEPGAQITPQGPVHRPHAPAHRRRDSSRSTTSSRTALFYGLDGARTLFGYPLALDRLYVALRPGTDADAVRRGRAGERSWRTATEAVSIPTIMDEGFTMTRQIFQLFQGYLAHGPHRRASPAPRS